MAGDQPVLGTGRTGGRNATTGVIHGRFALAVGMPDLKAPLGWKWTPLSKVAQLESGHTPSRKHSEYWDGDIPWIGIKDAVDNHGRTILGTYQHVTELGLENSSARLLPAKTVCLSRTASVGYVVVMGRPMATSQDFVNWVCGPGLDPQFLKYVLLAENEALWRFASGTTHQTIYYPEAKAFHVCLPPIEVQRRLAHILGTLDDKIELNQRTNETLEAMAMAAFKSWFVDFDPVRAKMDGRTPEGVDSATAKLFPDGFDESPLGSIPQGWEAMSLGNLCDRYDGEIRTGPFGTTLHAEDYCAEGVQVIAVRDIASGYLAADHQTPRVSGEVLARLGVFRVQEGDIVFGRKGAVERSAYISASQSGWLMGSDCIRLRMARILCPAIWAFGFRTPSHVAWMQQHATGTTMASLNQSILRAVPMVIPPIALLERLAKPFVAIVEQMEANRAEIATLAALRDALLPKLLSGEVSTAHAEKAMK